MASMGLVSRRRTLQGIGALGTASLLGSACGVLTRASLPGVKASGWVNPAMVEKGITCPQGSFQRYVYRGHLNSRGDLVLDRGTIR